MNLYQPKSQDDVYSHHPTTLAILFGLQHVSDVTRWSSQDRKQHLVFLYHCRQTIVWNTLPDIVKAADSIDISSPELKYSCLEYCTMSEQG